MILNRSQQKSGKNLKTVDNEKNKVPTNSQAELSFWDLEREWKNSSEQQFCFVTWKKGDLQWFDCRQGADKHLMTMWCIIVSSAKKLYWIILRNTEKYLEILKNTEDI